jgi:hypothetical protein
MLKVTLFGNFWEDAWAVGTLLEPHLLTATQIFIQQGEIDMDLFHAMPAMADYGHLIGNFGQVMPQPRNVKWQGINVILNTVQINPWAGRGFRCMYKGGGYCKAGQTPEVVADKLYDKYPNEQWRGLVILKRNNNA